MKRTLLIIVLVMAIIAIGLPSAVKTIRQRSAIQSAEQQAAVHLKLPRHLPPKYGPPSFQVMPGAGTTKPSVLVSYLGPDSALSLQETAQFTRMMSSDPATPVATVKVGDRDVQMQVAHLSGRISLAITALINVDSTYILIQAKNLPEEELVKVLQSF